MIRVLAHAGYTIELEADSVAELDAAEASIRAGLGDPGLPSAQVNRLVKVAREHPAVRRITYPEQP